MRAITITINNHKSKIEGNQQAIDLLRDKTKIKSPGAWYSPAFRNRTWDGYVKYVTEAGYFKTGLLKQMLDEVDKHNKETKKKKQIDVEIIDNREHFKPIRDILTVGKLTLRDYQLGAITDLKNHTVGGLKFPRGILYEATNSGKSLIAAALYKSYNTKRIGLLLINSITIYNQLVKEITELLGKDIVGEVSSKVFRWKKFNICMVQTLANRLMKNPKVRQDIQNADIVMVDEADELVNRKDCQKIMEVAFAAPLRVALTGTALKNKDKTKNMKLLEYFGPVIHRTSNTELIAKGVSTPPVIAFYRGNDEYEAEGKGEYAEEYENGITKNKKRHKRIWKRVAVRIEKKQYPIIILTRYKDHIKRLLKSKPEKLDKYTIEYVHGDTIGNEKVFEDFNKKKIDILIASMIIKRGKNLPALRTLINASGGDSESVILQILGRALRKDKNKKVVYVDEFFDRGMYLRRHSRHRINYYTNDGHEVLEPYKKYMKKYN